MREEILKNARILIVDDEHANVLLLERILRTAGFTNYKSTNDPRQVLPVFTKFQPDLTLLDLMMPYLDGFEVMKQLSSRVPDGTYLPILVLTADTTQESRQKALAMGANDFLSKPFDYSEVLLRITNLLETRFLHVQLQEQNQMLEEKAREHAREIEIAHREILHRLALVIECLDDKTGQHSRRVGELSASLAREMGLPKAQVESIRLAATLHDLGKIGIAESILKKPGGLTSEEIKQVEAHGSIGVRILSGSKVPLLQLAEEIVLFHHEHWDGTGHAQVRGESIPIAARIVALADAFDVLIHERPYRAASSEEDAVAEIVSQSGRQFDPHVVKVFLRMRRREELPRKIKETIMEEAAV